MAKINKVGHVVLNVSDLDTSIAFYTAALGMELMTHNTERHMAFLSFGTQHHDIARVSLQQERIVVPWASTTSPCRSKAAQRTSVSSTAGSSRRVRRLTDH